MNLDIISQTYGYTTFNKKLAHILGLKTALYWSVISDALYQAKKKNKVSETGYFVIDRKFVFEETTLTTPEQKQCEKILSTLGYLQNGAKTNSIAIDVGGIVELIQKDDPKQIDFIKSEISKLDKADRDEAKVEYQVRALKNRVKETDFEIREALFGWIDSLQGKGNVKTVEIFETELNNYTKDKKTKLELIKKATLNGYRDITWIINAYERDQHKVGTKPQSPASLTGKATNVATSLADVDLKRTF